MSGLQRLIEAERRLAEEHALAKSAKKIFALREKLKAARAATDEAVKAMEALVAAAREA